MDWAYPSMFSYPRGPSEARKIANTRLRVLSEPPAGLDGGAYNINILSYLSPSEMGYIPTRGRYRDKKRSRRELARYQLGED